MFENITYFCDEGYELKGFPGPYNCTEDGSFDIEEYPTCEGVYFAFSFSLFDTNVCMDVRVTRI